MADGSKKQIVDANRTPVHLSQSQHKLKVNRFGWVSNWVHTCVHNPISNQYFPTYPDRSKQRRITCNNILNLSYYLQCNTQSYLQFGTQTLVLPAMKYPICRITCNEIPNPSYYLQWNTQSVVLPAMKYPICRITCNEIPNLSYYLQWNTQSVVLPAMKYPVLPAMWYSICCITCNKKYRICRITCHAIPSLTCNSILKLLYYLQWNTQPVVLPAMQ